MARQDQTSGRSEHHAPQSSRRPPDREPDTIPQLAELVARGEIPFPRRLPADDQQRLAALVGGLRRARLLRFLARQIALDILRDAGRPDSKE